MLPDGRERRKRNKDKQVVNDWLFEQRKAISENRVIPDDKITFSAYVDRFLEEVAHVMVQRPWQSVMDMLDLR